jgi:multidrug efflux pump
MDITRTAIEKSRVTAVLLLILLAGGWIGYKRLPRAEDPGFIIRNALVTTHFPGASPERVEQLVTDPLEKAIQELPELDSISSTSRTGISVINVQISERYKQMRPIWDSLRRKIDREASKLPDGAHRPVVNDEYGDVFGVVLGLTGDGYSYAELKDIADEIRDELLRLPDLAKVEIYGAQQERIFIEYSNARLAEVGLSPGQLKKMLEAQNIVIPGGSARTGRERIAIEPSGNFESVQEIEQTIIKLPGRGELLYLRDLVSVRRGYIDPPAQKVHTASGTELRHSKRRFAVPCQRDAQCGKGICSKRGEKVGHCVPRHAALVLALAMREGGNITALGQQVEEQIQRFNQAYPLGIRIEKVNFQPKDVETVIGSFTGSLLQAVAVVMGAMILFLGVRTGLIVSALIPMAIMTSLLVMLIGGVGLDQISLAALIIALGMLVDNAVVMAESTMVQMQVGKSAKQAAIDSARELRIPLLTSSLTTSAAFLPIFLAKSAVGEYTAALFIVVTIALISSWLLSLTMTPLLCAWLLEPKPQKSSDRGFDTRFYRSYRALLLLFVRRPLVTVIVMLMVFVGGMALFRLVPKLFFPPSDRATFMVELDLQTGTAIEQTTRVVQRLETFLLHELKVKRPEADGVTTWSSYIGKGGPRFYLGYNPEPPTSSYAFLLVQATRYEIMDGLMERLRAFCREELPAVKATIKPRQSGPPVKYPVMIRLSGKETGKLFEIVEKVKAKLRELPKTTNVSDDWGIRAKKIVVRVDQARARRAGLTSQDVAVSLQTMFSGLRVTEYREGNTIIPVAMRSVAADRQDLAKLETLSVYSQATGRPVPLKQVADVELVWEPSKRIRYNRYQTVTVHAELQAGGLASAVNAALLPWLETAKRGWPLGYRFDIAGEAESAEKGNKSIGEQMPIAAFLIIFLLVAQFNSIRRPLIILCTLPLGLVGVALGLLATNLYFGFMTLLGVISLFGIVINNAIVLIDRIGIEINDNGREPAQAIIAAGQQRLRPILLTTFTTVAGLFPLWLGGSPMWWPMAVAIIFGLSFATVLTLGVVPALYALFFRVSFATFEYRAVEPTARGS